MFKYIYKFLLTTKDQPSIIFKLNIWLYTNLKIFKIKLLNKINYLIEGLSHFEIKHLNNNSKIFSYFFFYTCFVGFFFLLIILFILF